MSANELGQELHDKASRGIALSEDEQAHLKAWYARQDQDEFAKLAESAPSETLLELRAKVNAAVGRLLTVTQRIQSLTARNEITRQEIAALQQQLAQRAVAQPV